MWLSPIPFQSILYYNVYMNTITSLNLTDIVGIALTLIMAAALIIGASELWQS